MVRITGVITRHLIYEVSELQRIPVCGAKGDGSPKCIPGTTARFHLENTRGRIIVSSKGILDAMNFDTRMKDAKTDPEQVAVEAGEVVDIEVDGSPSGDAARIGATGAHIQRPARCGKRRPDCVQASEGEPHEIGQGASMAA